MKNRFRLYRRTMGGVFYIHDSQTGKQESLGTRDRAEATTLLNARNESVRQPQLNLHIAKAYLTGTDSGVSTRTWQNALDAIVESKTSSTKDRWRRAAKETALDGIRDRVIIETQAEQLLACLKVGTVSTNVHLRKLHNFCLSMNWLPWPLIPKRLWPEVRFQPKRAITAEEHQLIIEREKNPERRNFYELCWHLGGSQSDIANLKAEDVDWPNQTIAYARQKTGSLAMIHFGEDIEAILRRLPVIGPLFPYLQSVRVGDRATEFKQRCEGLGIKGVSLHSYRYAWAERAKQCGYPERFAQEALGHNSKAFRALVREQLQHGVQKFRIGGVGHFGFALVVFGYTPTGNHYGPPSTSFWRRQPPSGGGCARLATLAFAPPPPKGAERREEQITERLLHRPVTGGYLSDIHPQ